MSTSKTNKPKPTNKSAETVITSSKSGIFSHISFFKNFILAVFIGFFFLVLFNANEGYTFIIRDLIGENLKFINKNPNITEAQKLESKFGADGYVINQIKRATPEDAVLLFPPYEVIINDTSQLQFKRDQGGIKVRNWLVYYLYPRKIQYLSLNQTQPTANQKITHVVCINNWGYDLLNYEVSERQIFEVLPISK